jgi:predicted  nucleic acid-binding Zn-ribbon protein
MTEVKTLLDNLDKLDKISFVKEAIKELSTLITVEETNDKLTKENQTLKAKVEDLQDELREAQDEIFHLESAIEDHDEYCDICWDFTPEALDKFKKSIAFPKEQYENVYKILNYIQGFGADELMDQKMVDLLNNLIIEMSYQATTQKLVMNTRF